MERRKIAFIGVNKIVDNLLIQLLQAANPYPLELLSVCDPNVKQPYHFADHYAIYYSQDPIATAQQADVLILAVETAMLVDICAQLLSQIDLSKKLVCSIMPDLSCQQIYRLLTKNLNLVRLLPIQHAIGSIGLFTDHVNKADRDFITHLADYFGSAIWLEQEKQLNALIGIINTASTYFYFLMNAMSNEASRMGFEADLARKLVFNAAYGAECYSQDTSLKANRCSIYHQPNDMIDQVASKAGTTAAALRIFEQHHLALRMTQDIQTTINQIEKVPTL